MLKPRHLPNLTFAFVVLFCDGNKQVRRKVVAFGCAPSAERHARKPEEGVRAPVAVGAPALL